MFHPEAVCLSVELLRWKQMMASYAVCSNAALSGSTILYEPRLFVSYMVRLPPCFCRQGAF